MGSKRIYLSSPHMSSEGYEMQYIKEAFESNWIAPLGKNVDEFEKEFADYIGVRGAVALITGTAAIHMALKSLCVDRGDIVFCQNLTFAATCNPIIYQNAIPVFIDSDLQTWNMCPVALEEAFIKYQSMGKKPKAVIVVHLYGLAADLDKILEICAKYNVPLIEDVAESLGTRYKGKMTGSFGKINAFSFNGNKIITTSGGGMMVSNDLKAVEKAKFWATQSREKVRNFEHAELGYNYRMSNILAGIGRGQMKILDQRIEKKKYIFEFYKRNLSVIDLIEFMPVNVWNEPNYWLSCALCISSNKNSNLQNPVERIIDFLECENIEARPFWKPMHMQPFYESYDYIGHGVSERLYKHGFCLPSDTKMTEEDLYRIVKIIKKAIK